METENVEEMKKEVKEEDTLNTPRKDSGAAELNERQNVETLKFAVRIYCFIRGTSISDPGNK